MPESLHHETQLTAIAMVVLAALGCGLLMTRLRQPALVGYIMAGVLLGPSGLGLVRDREAVGLLAELGVLMLLFLLGMELSLRGVREVWKIAVLTTLVQIGAAAGITLAIGELLDWPLQRGILMGFVVAVSSTAVAVKMLDDIGELRTRVGQVAVGILIAQDLAVVPMMLVVGSFGADGGFRYVSLVTVLLSVGFLALLIVYLSRRQRIRLPFARLVGKSVDLTPLAGLAFCFGASAVSGMLGLSAAYGAFIAGLVIGNSTSRRLMLRHMAPIQSVLMMIFFLSIGLLLDLGFMFDRLALVLLLVGLIAIIKTALNIGLIRLFGETWPRAVLSGVVLAQIGEFSFIMAALGLSVGAIQSEAHKLIVAVTVLSLVVSPIWMEAARRLHRIILLGVTSGRETFRLTIGRDAVALLRRGPRPDRSMISMAGSATRWMGGLWPRPGGLRPRPGGLRPRDRGRPEHRGPDTRPSGDRPPGS